MIEIEGNALERARRLNALEDACRINARANALLCCVIAFGIGAVAMAAFGG